MNFIADITSLQSPYFITRITPKNDPTPFLYLRSFVCSNCRYVCMYVCIYVSRLAVFREQAFLPTKEILPKLHFQENTLRSYFISVIRTYARLAPLERNSLHASPVATFFPKEIVNFEWSDDFSFFQPDLINVSVVIRYLDFEESNFNNDF